MTTTKGFIKLGDKRILPITRGELVLDSNGNIALTSEQFAAGGNNAYGLISAAERQLLQSGTSSGGNLGIYDINTRLNYINQGLIIGQTPVNFYDANGNHTPITLSGEGISVTLTNGNNVKFALSEVTPIEVSDTIIRKVTTDKYGRVTAVEGSLITNADLPEEISGKNLSGCYTTVTEESTTTSLVNKKYVDDKFATVTGVASGGLRFGGGLSSWTLASPYLDDTYLNYYFKVTNSFTIPYGNLYPDGTITDAITVKVGDTLIVYKGSEKSCKFVYIPSADETETKLTVSGYNASGAYITPIDNKNGGVALKFGNMFSITSPGSGRETTITLPKASDSTDGYLSSSDYNTFKNYKNVSYTPSVQSGYEIGKLSIGTTDYTIYGKETKYELGVSSENPILQLKENGTVKQSITFIGGSGIEVSKGESSITIKSDIQIDSNSSDFLSVDSDNQTLSVKLGNVDENANITNGLVDFNTLVTFANRVHTNFTGFEEIENSLSVIEGNTYYYGSTALISAITI